MFNNFALVVTSLHFILRFYFIELKFAIYLFVRINVSWYSYTFQQLEV